MRKPKSSIRSKGQPNGERGVALVIALLAMTVLTALGFALMLSSSTESLIHGNFRNAALALYAARGGLDEARGRMGPSAVASQKIPPPATVNDIVYIRQDNTINPTTSCSVSWAPGVSCQDPDAPTGSYTASCPPAGATFSGRYLCLTAQTAGAGQVSYVWVKIQLSTQRRLQRNLAAPCNTGDLNGPNYCNPTGLNDTQIVYWTGNNLTLTAGSNPAFLYTAMAITPGGAARIIREVGSSTQVPPLPAGLTLDGPNPTFQPGSSNNFSIIGTDAGTPPTNVNAIGVLSAADDNAVTDEIEDLPASRQDNYPGINTSPDVSNVSSTLNSSYSSCSGLTSLLSTLQGAADHYYNGDQTSLPFPGTVAAPVINYVNGNLTISGAFSGTGILVVTGNLVFSGNPTYNGIIYVIGTGSFQQNGGGSGQFNGGIFVANTTTCPTGLGSPSYQVNGGGNNGIQYNSNLVNPPGGWFPITLISLNY